MFHEHARIYVQLEMETTPSNPKTLQEYFEELKYLEEQLLYVLFRCALFCILMLLLGLGRRYRQLLKAKLTDVPEPNPFLHHFTKSLGSIVRALDKKLQTFAPKMMPH